MDNIGKPPLCILTGHCFVNEVQTITQLFFPGEKFVSTLEENAAPASKGYTVVSSLVCDGSDATVFFDGSKIGKHFYASAELGDKRVVMLALYHALQSAVGAFAPWGSLTGIRPSKLVREWMGEGVGREGIVRRLMDPYCVDESKARLAVEVAEAEAGLADRIFRHSKKAIGLYVSVPFCPSRCLYCSFNTSHKLPDRDFMELYVKAVVGELRRRLETADDVSSVYIGGGTPTVLPDDLLDALLFSVADTLGTDRREFTVEAGRPDTITESNLSIMKKHGVSRISINPQTLNEATLELIGRKHTIRDFYDAFALAREVGIPDINVDLIAGLPGETIRDMDVAMEAMARLAPKNITVHTLAVKRASILNEHRGRYALPNPKTVWEMLEAAQKSCTMLGLKPYYLYRQKNMAGLFENIGYSEPGRECLYNVGMMGEMQTVIAIGAGAVTKHVVGDRITREFNAKDAMVYLEREVCSNG